MPGNQANVEYWFRLFYECLHGTCYGSTAGLAAWLAHLWLWIIFIGYILAIIALFIIVYLTVRLFELRKRESEFYSTLLVAPDTGDEHPRWKHIESLAQGTSPSEWREAIIEADILLDELLTESGYEGENIAEKLNSAELGNLGTLKDAWEAHKVRNQIAHEGSAFELSEGLVRRTISHYETVFRELNAI
ncbi:hypothetical protein A3A36_02915 [Candidatus Kaiserbacteria bacterium RIFCSPLOWO2_01_FULL_52_12b]|uniref:Uncharacterized protein n=1 Tax=Candidatus Kaiserbacteria bacterium RIFCSPLOWO2_01_FULL_52_12b TaxID=1798509 RepID=A0A1F6EXC6_9BACT|nr:MAG: hypothetical protein A3A36_02915 [Candidatus Kaiserbacteria bacterium RIFCSPLOWO2_01_FULL_52_12b]